MRRLNILKMLVLPNGFIDSTQSQSKVPASYFVDIDKLTLKFTGEEKGLE